MACPICARPVHADYRPFCSRRCADADLAKWLDGSYRVPLVEAEGEGAEAGAADEGAEPSPLRPH